MMSVIAILQQFPPPRGHRFVKNRTTTITINANTTNSMIVFNVVVMGVSPLTKSPARISFESALSQL